jgi:calreticulin
MVCWWRGDTGGVFADLATVVAGSWESRWVHSAAKGSDNGKFVLTAGKWYGNAEEDKGIQTSQDAKFYAISAQHNDFSNEGKDLVVQLQVKHEQTIDCGGGYVKLYPTGFEQKKLVGETPYNIMFGPDICGYSTKKVHVIFAYKGQNLLLKKEIRCKDDDLSHVYTLVVHPDNTYDVLIDLEKVQSGSLEEDWDFLPAKEILDPQAKKPEDWDDRKKIADETDVKPADWDVPEYIADPNAKKPEDWDDEMDGEWEPPQIKNPEYKGEWKAREIDNPNYKGEWVHPKIPNPEYSPDANLYKYASFGGVGIDIWQVKAGTIFDNIFIGDDLEAARAFAQETWGKNKDGELKMRDAAKEAERKAREEQEKAAKAEADAHAEEEEEEEEEDEKDEL